ncbi:MAG: hypothetical protein ACC707_06075, partial [Thiohalomonadales bacterium]
MLNLSLKYRIAAIIFLLEAMMMAAVLATTYVNHSRSLDYQSQAHEQVLLNLLGELSRVTFLTSEYSEIQSYIE